MGCESPQTPPTILALYCVDSSSHLCGAIRAICSGDSPGIESIGGPADSASINYVMFNHVAVYVGKANIRRQNGPGWPARVGEHMKGILFPSSAGGGKPHYKLMRGNMGSIGMLPTLWTTSEARAFAFESIAIRMEAPMANVHEEMEASRLHVRGTKLEFRGRRVRNPS